jgi:hypothetical protein
VRERFAGTPELLANSYKPKMLKSRRNCTILELAGFSCARPCQESGQPDSRIWTPRSRIARFLLSTRQICHHVLVRPEMERGRSPLVSIPPFGAGIFKASRSTDPMRIWKQRKEQIPALPFIVSMSPPGHPSAWLRPRRARFRFARQDHCSFTTSIRLNFRMGRKPLGTAASARPG